MSHWVMLTHHPLTILLAELYFESMATFQAALPSPEGQAAAGDLPNFANGGVTLLVGEVVGYNPVLVG
jgi:uncharacterized protein (TIGR02118 family)